MRDKYSSLANAVTGIVRVLKRVRHHKIYGPFLALKIRQVAKIAPALKQTAIREFNRSKFGKQIQNRHMAKPLGSIRYFK